MKTARYPEMALEKRTSSAMTAMLYMRDGPLSVPEIGGGVCLSVYLAQRSVYCDG